MPQACKVNFLHETLCLNWAAYCLRYDLPFSAPIPEKFDTDVRQDFSHQMRDGRFVCLGGSRPFCHFKDRSYACIEVFHNLGWSNVELDGIDERIEEIEAEMPANLKQVLRRPRAKAKAAPVPLSPTKQKRNARVKKAAQAKRRVSRVGMVSEEKFYNKGIALAGNAMALPDLSHVFVPLVLSMPNGHPAELFEHDLPRTQGDRQRRHRQWRQGILSFDPSGHISDILNVANESFEDVGESEDGLVAVANGDSDSE